MPCLAVTISIFIIYLSIEGTPGPGVWVHRIPELSSFNNNNIIVNIACDTPPETPWRCGETMRDVARCDEMP